MNASDSKSSPSWSRSTRLIVGLIALALLLGLMWRFQALVGQIVVAAMLAYVLDPLIALLARRTRLSRGVAALVVYFALTLAGLGLMGGMGVAAANQVAALIERVPTLIESAGKLISEVARTGIDVGPLHLALDGVDWDALGARLLELGGPALGQGGQVAAGALDIFGWMAITFIVSIYIAIDLPRLGEQIAGVAHHSGYRDDYDRISRDISQIWSRYLRGQIILAILIGLITFVMLIVLGVEGALALAVIAGALQAIPYVGPTVSAILIVIVALFQPANYLGLAPVPFALLVGGVTLVVQQVSGNLLLPTVLGDALRLSPLTVLISLIAGAAVAGLLGVILAAPVAGTLKVVAGYVWRKLLDLPPFPDAEPPPGKMSRLIRRTAEISQQIQRARSGAKPVNKPPKPERAEKTP